MLLSFFNGGNCVHNVLIAANWTFQKGGVYMCWANVILVSIDRYVAILHPLVYEARLTYTAIKVMMSVAWIAAFLLAATFWLWFINANMRSCSIVPGMYQALDVAVYVLTSTMLIFVYGRILRVALQQRARVEAEELAVQRGSSCRPHRQLNRKRRPQPCRLR